MFQHPVRFVRFSVRCLSLAALLVLFLAMKNLTPLCGYAEDKTSKPPTPDAATPKETKDERPPFDLKYVPPDAIGVIAVRPTVIFSDPAMKPLARMANEALTQFLQSSRITLDPKLSIDEIEQVVGYISIIPGGKETRGIHTLGTGLTMIRTTHEFDWVKLLRQLDPKTEEVRWKGLVYYKCRPLWLGGLSSEAHVFFFIPDKRTLVLPGPGALKEGQAGEAKRRPPHFSWDKEWKRVEHDLFAIAMDNRWANGLSQEQIGGEPWANALTQHASTMVAAVNWQDGIDFQAFLDCKGDAAATQAVLDLETLLASMRRDLKNGLQVVPAPDQKQPVPASVQEEIDSSRLQFLNDLVNHARVLRRESTACVHTNARMSAAELAKGLMSMLSGPAK